MENKLAIIGCGGHARSVADVVLFNDPQTEIIFVDENARENEFIMGCPIVKEKPSSFAKIHYASGDNIKREQMFNNDYVSIISKDAYVAPTATVGNGSFVAHHVHIGPEAKIGKACIINTSCVIDHEVCVGDFTHISANSTVCGRCKIGKNVFVGAGSVIKDKISICDDVIIGAGSVVVKNIVEAGTYVGCPAKKKG